MSADEEYFEVDRIYRHRGSKARGDLEFFVHWKNYDESQNSWVRQEDMCSPLLISEYFQELKEAKKRKEEAKMRVAEETSSANKKSLKENKPIPATSGADGMRRGTTSTKSREASPAPGTSSSSAVSAGQRESDTVTPPVQSTSQASAQDLPVNSRESSAGPSTSKMNPSVLLKKMPVAPPLPKKKDNVTPSVKSTSQSSAQDDPVTSRESSVGPSTSTTTIPMLKKIPIAPPLPKKMAEKAAAPLIDHSIGEPEPQQNKEKIQPRRAQEEEVEIVESMDCDESAANGNKHSSDDDEVFYDLEDFNNANGSTTSGRREKRITGYDKGLKAERIVSSLRKNGKRFAEVKFQGTNEVNIISFKKLKEIDPTVVYRYHLRFMLEDTPMDEIMKEVLQT